MCESYLNPNSNTLGWGEQLSKTVIFDINDLVPMVFICNNGTAYVFKFLSFRDTYILKNLGTQYACYLKFASKIIEVLH